MTYNSQNDSGAHAHRASEVQANEDQAKPPWVWGLVV